MKGKLNFRKVRPSDFEKIVELDNKYSDEPPGEDVFTVEELEEYYKSNKDFIWVVENEDRIIGFIIAFSNQEEKSGHLEMIFVHPNFRREYIGSRLVEKVLNEYDENGIEKVFVIAPKENEGLLKFYKNLNFNLKAYYMKKTLK